MFFQTGGKMTFEADMHCHSYYSDGYDSPAKIVKKAKTQGLKAICLTDHDNYHGMLEFKQACELANIDFLIGIEFTTIFEDVIIHILGYGLDILNQQLNLCLPQQWVIHQQRMFEMLLKYETQNEMCISMEDLKKDSRCKGPCLFVHWVMDYRMRKFNLTLDQAKAEITGNGFAKTDFHSGLMLTALQAVDIVDNAGGLAVIAHPGRIAKQLKRKGIKQKWEEFISILISKLENQGLDGIEVWHPKNNPQQTEFLAKLADMRGLIKTGGSDYHGIFHPQIKLGQYGISFQAFLDIKSKISKKRLRKS